MLHPCAGATCKPDSQAAHPRTQTTNQTPDQPTNQPPNQPTNQSINQPADQPTKQPSNKPTNQPTNQPTNNKQTNKHTKQNKTKQNKTKQKQNETKQHKTKQNKTKQNKHAQKKTHAAVASAVRRQPTTADNRQQTTDDHEASLNKPSDLQRHVSANRRQLPLQLPHASLPCVRRSHSQHRAARQEHVLSADAVLGHLLGYQVRLRNAYLLF